jgi:DNA-binding beta-propeller fold protein YncE
MSAWRIPNPRAPVTSVVLSRRSVEMSASALVRFWLAAPIVVVCVALQGVLVQTQQRGGTVQTDKVQPVNSGANPFRVIRDWAQLNAEGRPWGGSNGVAIDRDGRSVWATDRCSPGTTPGCLGTKWNPVHHFDESGKEIRSFGGGMFVWPHGIHADREGNVWVTDARAASPEELKKFPGENDKGSVVVKFSPEGKVLMMLGRPGVRGHPPDALTDPTDVVTDPSNGDVYVAESHTAVTDANLAARISVFDRNGKFLRVIGRTGTGPGEFRTPHALEFDSQGRLIVADRHNHRIQILTKDGTFIREYRDFGRTSGLAIDKDDTIYTADSESTDRVHPGWRRGIRIGSLKDGKVTMFVPPHTTPNSPDGAMGEGIAIDPAGNVYTAEAQLRGVTKYVKN